MSKLNYKDPAESALVNDAFLGRNQDDTTTGVLTLANVVATSGEQVVNPQRQININTTKVLSDDTLNNGGEFFYHTFSTRQIKRVIGNGGSITMSNTPFGTAPDIQDGTLFYIIGQHNSDTVAITHNDIDDGCLLNGTATLRKGECLQLLWDATNKRFLDVGRNF